MEGKETHLQKDFAKYAICLFSEHGRKDDGDTVGRCLDVDDFLITVVEGHELALASSCSLKLLVLLEAELEGCGERIAFKQCERLDEGIAFLYKPL